MWRGRVRPVGAAQAGVTSTVGLAGAGCAARARRASLAQEGRLPQAVLTLPAEACSLA